MPALKPYPLKPKHIKWAYVLPGKPGYNNSLELFRRVCTMLTSEIMRNDEVAVVCFDEKPMSVIQLRSPETAERGPFAASFPYPGLSWEPAFNQIRKLLSTKGAAIGTTVLTILFFRPQTHESFDIIERFGDYSNALCHAARQEKIAVNYTLTVDTSLDTYTSVSAAQIHSTVAPDFYKSLSEIKRSGDLAILNKMFLSVIDAVDGWTQHIYNKGLELRHCREKNRYPIAPLPMEFIDADAKLDFHVFGDENIAVG